MRDQWFGDEGDFVKYALLRKICGIYPECRPLLSLGVVWYLRESKRLGYLDPGGQYGGQDPDLFRSLRGWIRDERGRGVSLIEKSFLFPADTVWFSDIVEPSEEPRKEWLHRARDAVARSRVVFLDPDVGLAPDKPTGDHVLGCELEAFCCLDQQPTVVVYQHSWRMEREKQIETQIEKHADRIRRRIIAVQHKTLRNRFFYVIPSTEDDGQLVLDRITKPFKRIRQIGSR